MSATYTAESLTTKALRRVLDFDPDSGSAVLVTLNPAAAEKGIAIAGYRRFLFGIMRSVGTGTISAAKIVASTTAAGTGSATDVVAHALGSAPDAVGDTIWLECDVSMIQEVLPTAAYVCLSITLQTSTDECVVYAEAANPVFERASLTADYIS